MAEQIIIQQQGILTRMLMLYHLPMESNTVWNYKTPFASYVENFKSSGILKLQFDNIDIIINFYTESYISGAVSTILTLRRC